MYSGAPKRVFQRSSSGLELDMGGESKRIVRVIDTGVRGGRENMAFDRALIEARNAGRVPQTIRFMRFRPCALVGLHQMLSHEVRLDYCRARGIEVGRRITGGGALYLDGGQIGWELALERSGLGADLGAIAARLCRAAAAGLQRLGVPAEFRPRNDIEVHGRKVSGTGGLVDGTTLFFQGTLLIDFDPTRMIEVLKVPVDKLARRDLDDARRRVVSLREVLGRVPPLAEIEQALIDGFCGELQLEPQWDEASEYEEDLARRLYAGEVGTDDFVHLLDDPGAEPAQVSATLVRRGGTVRADLRLEGAQGERIREALITGDFFMSPARAVLDLEASLRGAATAEAGAAVEGFFGKNRCEMPGLSALDFREAVESALGQIRMRAAGHELRGHWRGPRPAQAPTLVFLHDALGSVRLWRDFPDQLVRSTGCGALVYDRWGSGESEPLAPPYSQDYLLEEALHALPEVLDATGVREAVLIGQSDGASIALAHAGAFPQRIRGVIAMSPHLFLEPRSRETIRRQIEDFERGDLKARLARHHGSRTEALFGRLVQIWTAQGPGASAPLAPYVAKLACPVLAIQGEDDEFFSAAQLDELERLLAGGVERLRIAGAAHYPMHQARNEVLAASIRFIRAVTASDTHTPRAAAGE